MYSIRFTKTAVKSLKKIPEKIQENILNEIDQLAISTAVKQNVKKLINSPHYRLRVGSYRILFD